MAAESSVVLSPMAPKSSTSKCAAAAGGLLSTPKRDASNAVSGTSAVATPLKFVLRSGGLRNEERRVKERNAARDLAARWGALPLPAVIIFCFRRERVVALGRQMSKSNFGWECARCEEMRRAEWRNSWRAASCPGSMARRAGKPCPWARPAR